MQRQEKISLKFTQEMRNYIIQNIPKMPGKELTEKFNKKFNTSYSKRYLQKQGRLLGVNGLSGDFKKGMKAWNVKPIGTERLDKNKNFIEIKVKEGKDVNDFNECWERKHRYMYKKYHGEIPKNCVIIFLNRDRKDFSKENLVAVDEDVFRLASSALLIPKEPCDKEITRTGIMIAELYIKLNQIKARNKNK